jgi:hypothetical protein
LVWGNPAQVWVFEKKKCLQKNFSWRQVEERKYFRKL